MPPKECCIPDQSLIGKTHHLMGLRKTVANRWQSWLGLLAFSENDPVICIWVAFEWRIWWSCISYQGRHPAINILQTSIIDVVRGLNENCSIPA